MSESEKKGILDNYSDVLTTVDLMSILHTEYSPYRQNIDL